MFGQVPPTAYDVRFPFLGFPVRVHPLFWVLSAFLSWSFTVAQGEPELLPVSVLAIFVSILWHEFGHAIAARLLLDADPSIVLHHFGGYASWENGRQKWTPGRSILVTLAGPGFQAGLGGLALFAIYAFAGDLPRAAYVFLVVLGYASLFWAAVNLLPMLPLDGGQITRDILVAFKSRYPLTYAGQIGIVTCVAVAGLLFYLDKQDVIRFDPFNLIILALIGFTNYQVMQSGR